MAVYRVYESPQVGRTDRVAFVRDGFTWSAAIFGPLWMIRHGLWLVLALYIGVIGALLAGLSATGASAETGVLVFFLVAIFVGLEAATFRQDTLIGRGWRDAGVIVARNVEAAERRFFDRQVVAMPATPAAPAELPPSSSGVIGLFPSPGASR
jgi:hypothetical protein